MERWIKKVAIVTGASAGIGAAICKALAEENVIVIGLARRLQEMATTVKESISKDKQKNFHYYQCDVQSEENVKKTFEWIVDKFGGIDILVNNAAFLANTLILDDNSTNDILSTINTDILGVIWCTREAFKSMRKRNTHGYVIMMNSICGHSIPQWDNFHPHMYFGAKHAITALAECLRREFSLYQTKIKITSISPGVVATAMVSDLSDVPKLTVNDVADAVLHCLQTPPHVQLHEMIIKPIGEQV